MKSALIIKNKCDIINLGDSLTIIHSINMSLTPSTLIENLAFNITHKVTFQMSIIINRKYNEKMSSWEFVTNTRNSYF